jgi:hypothetical protein
LENIKFSLPKKKPHNKNKRHKKISKFNVWKQDQNIIYNIFEINNFNYQVFFFCIDFWKDEFIFEKW